VLGHECEVVQIVEIEHLRHHCNNQLFKRRIIKYWVHGYR